jgi:BirA family biotin operon repressor/biotin-[acetyl-CoA-carboxylase] ligase
MDVIKNYAPNTVIIADEQTRGRGKQNRKWFSENSNNLYMSLSIEANDSRIDYSNYSFLTAIAMVKTLENLANRPIGLETKWPNDLLVNGKKTGGILLEMDSSRGLLVIGLGLNIDRHPEKLESMAFSPTDLSTEGYSFRKQDIIDKFLEQFRSYSTILHTHGFRPIGDEWIRYAYNFKRKITVKTNSLNTTGIFEDLAQDGSLVLSTERGRIIVRSADIF